jgi:eukaryotic-like serine/threonine-protein kinase
MARFTTHAFVQKQRTGEIADAIQSAMIVGRYELVEEIGRGASGIVYRARRLEDQREVALKMLLARRAAMLERFEREAEIVRRLCHPNTIRVFEAGRSNEGVPYIVTELLRGRSLELALRGRPMSIARTANIAVQICGAIAEAHAAGVIHRDLTPANVFLDARGGGDFVKVIDFGIARDEHASRITEAGLMLGTLAYVAPEQALGQPIDARADIYSLGVMMFEMLTGAPPFSGSQAEMMAMHLCRTPPRMWTDRSALSPPEIELERLVLSMLSKSPAARPHSMIEVRDVLEAIARQLAGENGARVVPPEPRTRERVTQIALEDLAPAAEIWRRDRVELDSWISDQITSAEERPLDEPMPAIAALQEALADSVLAQIGVLMLALAIGIAVAAAFAFG